MAVNVCQCGDSFDDHDETGVCMNPDCECELYWEEEEVEEVEQPRVERDTRMKCEHGNNQGECLICFNIEEGRTKR